MLLFKCPFPGPKGLKKPSGRKFTCAPARHGFWCLYYKSMKIKYLFWHNWFFFHWGFPKTFMFGSCDMERALQQALKKKYQFLRTKDKLKHKYSSVPSNFLWMFLQQTHGLDGWVGRWGAYDSIGSSCLQCGGRNTIIRNWMQEIPYGEANTFYASQIPHILRNTKVHFTTAYHLSLS